MDPPKHSAAPPTGQWVKLSVWQRFSYPAQKNYFRYALSMASRSQSTLLLMALSYDRSAIGSAFQKIIMMTSQQVKRFLQNWSFVRGIHRWLVVCLPMDQYREHFVAVCLDKLLKKLSSCRWKYTPCHWCDVAVTRKHDDGDQMNNENKGFKDLNMLICRI